MLASFKDGSNGTVDSVEGLSKLIMIKKLHDESCFYVET